MKKFFMMVILCCFFMVGCTSPDNAIKVLKNEGFTNIQMTGYDFFACSDNDTFSTGFTATKNGKTITGVVCSGILKGSTIRYR